MQRISVLLQKLQELNTSGTKLSLIEADLMLDYTRVLYADLLDVRSAIVRTSILPADEPTLDELAAAYEEKEEQILHPPSSPIPPRQSSRPSIASLIGINDKYLLLSAIFSNDVSAYEFTITTLSNMPTLTEARHWMDEQNWPQDEIAVQLLKDIVQQYFA